MTNEEIINYGSMMPSARSAAQCACDMKDKQFKEYLENKVKSYKSRGEDFFATEIIAIEEIINELFKED